MKDVAKRIIVLFLCLTIIIVTISIVYFNNLFKNAREIEDVDHLSGQRIGVISGYEGDYILSDREDITLLRYESEADVLLALVYKQIDAAALTDDMADYILSVSQGFKINEKPIAKNNMASVFGDGSKLISQFQEFIDEFKNTDEYQKYIDRCNNYEYHDGSPIIIETGSGETIRVGYSIDLIPLTFFDTINRCPNGSEVDIIKYFANYMNYKIEWVPSAEVSGLTDLAYRKIDILLTAYSEIYRKECDNSELIDLGPNYRESSIVILEVEDYDNIVIGK